MIVVTEVSFIQVWSLVPAPVGQELGLVQTVGALSTVPILRWGLATRSRSHRFPCCWDKRTSTDMNRSFSVWNYLVSTAANPDVLSVRKLCTPRYYR